MRCHRYSGHAGKDTVVDGDARGGVGELHESVRGHEKILKRAIEIPLDIVDRGSINLGPLKRKGAPLRGRDHRVLSCKNGRARYTPRKGKNKNKKQKRSTQHDAISHD